MPVKKKNPSKVILTVLVSVLLLLVLLKFDVVSNAIDPDGKLGVRKFADDAFPIVLGLTLIVIGIAAAASVWVAIALIAVGVVMLASKAYSIWKRNRTAPVIKQE